MFTTGSTASDTVPEEARPEVTEKTILDKAGECLWWVINYFQHEHHQMEARRYRDPRDMDPNYGHNLRELEGGIEESEPPLRIGRYQEGGEGDKDTSWQKWILGIVSLSLVGMLSWALGKLDTLNQEVATLQATQTMGFAAIAQRQTADEQRIDRVESRVFRGNP